MIYIKDARINYDFRLSKENADCSVPKAAFKRKRMAFLCPAEEGRNGLHTQDFDAKIDIRISGKDEHISHFAWGPSGYWIYFASEIGGRSDLFKSTSTGTQVKQLTRGEFGDITYFDIAPGGRRIAVQGYQHSREQIWIGDMEFNSPMRVVPGNKNAIRPKWSPDGKRLAFLAQDPSRTSFYNLEVFTFSDNNVTKVAEGVKIGSFCWSRDGRMVFYSSGINVMDLNVFKLDSMIHRKVTSSRIAGVRNELNPRIFPLGDRDGLMFEAVTESSSKIIWLDLETREEKPLVELPGYNFLK
ncbi:TolB family protein [Fibrobacterota bacterium]